MVIKMQHVGSAHANIEQYIVPYLRNLIHNPVRKLLLPHFRITLEANRNGV